MTQPSGRALDIEWLRVLLVVAAVAAVGLQCWLLYTPNQGGPDLFRGADKVVHFAMFAGVTGLGTLASRRPLVMVVANALHGAVSEVVQWRWIAGRSGSWTDLAADMVGVAAGFWVARGYLTRRDWAPVR